MAFVLLAAYATGIAMVQFLAPWTLSVQCIIVGLLILLWAVLRHSPLAWVPLLGMLLMTGFLSASLQLVPPTGKGHIAHLADNSYLSLEGKILTVEKRAVGGYRLLLETHKARRDQQTAKVSGRVLLYVKEGTITARSGQVICWRSRLQRPGKFGNPGEFDYPLYLAAQKIYVTAFVEKAHEIAVLVNHPLTQGKRLENWRQSLAKQIEETVPEDASGYLQSLLLGMRGGISNEQRQLLANSGVAHLFAISGLHFGLLSLLLYSAGKWLYTRSRRLILICPPQRILPILLLLPLFTYLLLTGNAWGTRRAFIMICVIAVLYTRNRRTAPAALLATVAFVILLVSPLALFQPGFQLSFAGVAGIMAWLPVWQKPLLSLSKPVRLATTLILTTTAATLATAPATLWHFHQLSPAGLISNLVAIPLIAWGSVPLGLVSLALLPFAKPLAETGLILSAELVTLTISVAEQISRWPGLTAVFYYLTTTKLLLLIAVLLCMIPLRQYSWRWPVRVIVLVVAIVVYGIDQPDGSRLRITALSVGQGDATLVTLNDKTHYLVDGGGMPGSSIDTGERLVAPALGRLGVQSLAGVILTHNHPDHSSGLAYILESFSVAEFYTAANPEDLPVEIHNSLDRSSVPVHHLDKGWRQLRGNSGQGLYLFVPSQASRDINERSIAVFAGDADQGVLLTADLGKEGLKQLVNGLPGRSSLLKLPHHGSRHSHPERYLKALRPTMAFVSAGKNNAYGFPHRETLTTCHDHGVPLYRTDQEGMLTFRLIDGKWHAQTGFI